jgi:putative flippase GtrA
VTTLEFDRTTLDLDPTTPTAGLRRHVPRLVRYGTVSIVSTAFSLTILTVLVASGALSAGWGNLVATLCGAVPSFELNRRWVWPGGGRPRLAQAVPFVAMSLAGLALSAVLVAVTEGWSSEWSDGSRALLADGSNMAAFGSLWLVQFVICDRHLFGRR